MNYPRILLAGTHSGVGKTTVAIGLMLALKRRGLKVAPFKTGPDYIDPTYHLNAAAQNSYNLDTWMLSRGAVLELFSRHAEGSDISVIEGVMGLYDGLQDTEAGSTAYLAKLLNCPAIIVLDARSSSRSAAAIVLGFKQFDKKVKLAGVILNNISGPNHYRYIKSAIENETKVPVLGYLPHAIELKLPERHLGLVPTWEKKLYSKFLHTLASLTRRNINLNLVFDIARSAPRLGCSKKTIYPSHLVGGKLPTYEVGRGPEAQVTIAIAKDKAFNFYYQDNLEILKHLGARLVEFSPLENKELPRDIDGLYIGGGYPELFASRLAKNTWLKKEIYQKADCGLPIYAECAGLMYLADKLVDFKKRIFPMAGIFRCACVMGAKAKGLGYIEVETIKDNILSKKGESSRAHIFHWSFLERLPGNLAFAYRAKKNGAKLFYDGLIKNNVLASYAHLHFASNLNFAKNFIISCKAYKDVKKTK